MANEAIKGATFWSSFIEIILLQVDKTRAAKHACIDDKTIESESKAPFLDVPAYVETRRQDLKEYLEYTRNPDYGRCQDRRDHYLSRQKAARAIPRATHCHGQIDYQIPEANQGGKIIKEIVCIHHVWKKAAQHIESYQHRSRASERVVGPFVKEHSVSETCHEDVRSDEKPDDFVDPQHPRCPGVMVDQDNGLHPSFPLICLISREKRLVFHLQSWTAVDLVQWCRDGATYGEGSQHKSGRAKPHEFCERVLLLNLIEQLCTISVIAIADG